MKFPPGFRIVAASLAALALYATTAAAQTNLAAGKNAVASSTQFGVPNNVTDGVVTAPSRWGSVYAGDPEVANAQSIYVDLDSAQTFNRVILRWEAAYGSAYKIETSNTANGTDWVERFSVTAGDGGEDICDFPGGAVTARYVRMLGVTRGTGWGYSLWEFEVYNNAVGGAPVVNSATTASGTIGVAFNYTITATNSPTSYSATGLPSGLALNTTTGVISGTPTAVGTSNITIGATNGGGTGTASLALTISAAGSGTNLALNQPANASSFQAGNAIANANDGNATGTRWTASDGTFPQWWRVDLGSSQSVGRVDIAWYATATRSYKYLIETSTDDVNYTTRVDKSTNTAFGDTSDAFSAVSARYVRVTVTGSNVGWASAFEIAVFAPGGGGSAPVINSALTAGGTVNAAFSYTITATNTPTSFGATGLPSGLSVNTSTGVISGTPTATGTSNITISATNASGTDTKTLVLTVNPASGGGNLALGKSVSASSSEGANPAANANDDNATGTRWTAANGTFPQWWRVDLGSSQSVGRVDVAWYASATRSYKYLVETSTDDVNYTTRVDKSGNTAFGNTSDAFAGVSARYVRVTVTGSSAGWASAFEIAVFAPGGGGSAPVINSALTAGGTVSTAFSYTITATNSPTSFGASGLPSGLSVNTSTGVISGTPTATGTSNITISATNASGTDTKTLVLTVSTSAPTGNLALNKTATASTPPTGTMMAPKAVDGVANTRWNSASSHTEWFQVDLGQSYSIGKVVLRWEAAYGKDYKIQVSQTGAAGSWTDAATLTGMTNQPVVNVPPNHIVHTVKLGTIASGVPARYVRMQGVLRGTGYGYSLYEFEVYAHVPPPNQTGNQTIQLNFPVQGFAFGKVAISPTPLSITPTPDVPNGSNPDGSLIAVLNPTAPQTFNLTFPPNTIVTMSKNQFSGGIPNSDLIMETVDHNGDTVSGSSIQAQAANGAAWNAVVFVPPTPPGNPPANWVNDPYVKPTPVPTGGSFGVSSPGNNAMITNTRRPTFSWAAAAGASSYDLYVNVTRNDYDWNAKGNLLDRFTKVNAAPITGTSHTIAQDLPDRWTYRWYVVANNGARSDMRTFGLYIPTLETIDDGVNLITQAGLQFRDLNKNGTLEPFEDWRNAPGVRAADLLGRMSATQKAYQLFFNTQVVPQAGFGFGPFGPADGLNYQKNAAATQFAIPAVVLGDNIHGFKTAHPTQPGLAAGRDQQTAWECADMQRREEIAVGYRGTLSPLAEVGTKVLYPRIQEGNGEDADYAAAQVRAMVAGLQGGPEINPKSIMITVKHWPSQGGGGEAGVVFDGTSIWYHMRPWHAVNETNAACVMPGYSGSWLLNTQGRGAGDDAGIIGFLRGNLPGMGYQGVIMTDWLPSGAWIRACIAGSDVMGGADPTATLDAADGGGSAFTKFVNDVPIARINDACLKVLDLKFRLGIFEDPYGGNVNGVSAWQTPENTSIAYNAAAQSLTLLKNDGALPLRLNAGQNIVINGPRADDPSCMVTWRSDFHETEFGNKTIYRAIRDRAQAEGLNVYAPNVRTPVPVPGGTTIHHAIVVVGESYFTHGTFWNKDTPYLPDDTTNGQAAHDPADAPQFSLIQQYRSQGIPTTVIVMLPRPYVLTGVEALANAMVAVYRPGDFGGPAIADMLFGDFLPQGRLPWQLPRNMSQVGVDIQAQWQQQPDRWDLPFDLGANTQEIADIKAHIAAGGSFPANPTTGNPLYQYGYGIQGFGLTDSTPPTAFTTSAPGNGASITGAMPALAWNTSSDPQTGIQKYEVYLDGNLIHTTRKGTSVSLASIGVSLSSGSHSWYVKAINWANGSTNTPTANFTISDTTAPAAFLGLYPAASSSVAAVNGNVTFYWEQSTDAGTGINRYIMKLDGADQTLTTPSAPVSPTANIALGRTATASATAYSTPNAATDGNTGTRWGAPGGAAGLNNDVWWQVDLGGVYSVKQIVIRWEAAYGRDYDLQVSIDGNTWTTLKQARNMTGGAAPIVHTHNSGNGLAAGIGRYVRFQGVTRGTSFGYSFWEFEVNGVGTESKTIPVSAGSHTWTVRAIDGANNTTSNSNGTISFTRQ